MRQLRIAEATADELLLTIADETGDGDRDDTGDGGVIEEQFALPIDERLRDAVTPRSAPRTVTHTRERSLSRLEAATMPQLSPKEIQRRIRAGATVDEVAADTGEDADRIERFAYPILLERSSIAERARSVRPLADATMGTSSAAAADSSLAEIVTDTLTERGQQQGMQWDAYKDERGWILTLSWHAGRTENHAEWVFAAGPDGGSVTPGNAGARQLVEPEPMPLRTIDSGSEQLRLTADEYDVAHTVTDARSASRVGGADAHGTSAGQSSAGKTRRGHRPAMPSWEDVLLGTRAAK